MKPSEDAVTEVAFGPALYKVGPFYCLHKHICRPMAYSTIFFKPLKGTPAHMAVDSWP